jgi:hypothetical protein
MLIRSNYINLLIIKTEFIKNEIMGTNGWYAIA